MNAGPISQKLVFLLHQSGKNNKLGSVTKIPEVLNERFKRIFSKGLDIGFFKDVSDDFTKGALRAIKLRIRT
jgi:hypothetical protein